MERGDVVDPTLSRHPLHPGEKEGRTIRSRALNVTLAIALLAIPACRQQEPVIEPEIDVSASPRDEQRASSTPRPGPLGGEDATPPDGARPPNVAPATDAPGPRPRTVPPSDDAEVGRNAYIYLNRRVPKLVVEVDAARGKAPSAQTLDLLRSRLGSVADKPDGIVFRPTQTIPAGDGAWSVDDLREAEQRYRTTHSSPATASMYLLFVDGDPPKEDAIGVAYSASAAALFSDQIDEASTVLVGDEAIEMAATVHEVGHLLSLVNLGYTSPRDHEDPDHRSHSDNPDSVMFWAVDNVGVVSLLGGRTEPPTDFDSDDRADLADVRAGRLGRQNR